MPEKARLGLMFSGFANALEEVCRADMLGSSRGQYAWRDVSPEQHFDALCRHLLAHMRGDDNPDGVPHTASIAWRALAILEIESIKKTTTRSE